MSKRNLCIYSIADSGWAAVLLLLVAVPLPADWPMPGHDPQRTSRANDATPPPTRAIWHKKIDAFIPSRAQIVTLEAAGARPRSILVAAADGIHSLDPNTGVERWLYRMARPPGDAPTVEGAIAYVAGTDGTIHAIHTADGRKVWQTKRTGSPFYVNPLVVNGRIYAGGRDGVFYCFGASDGGLIWFKRTEAPIAYSAAYQSYPDAPDGVVFFASQNRCAYALDAKTGAEAWRRCNLPGATFVAFWPVVAGERVLFAASTNYPTEDFSDLGALARDEVLLDEQQLNARIDSQGRLAVDHHIAWLNRYPGRRSVLVLDRKTGQDAETSPFLWWGNPGGQRYPPAVGADGMVWATTPWLKSFFGSGRFAGWRIGESSIRLAPLAFPYLESADEPTAYSLVGQNIFHNDGGDGSDSGGVFPMDGDFQAASWAIDIFHAAFGEYWGRWAERRYGNSVRITNPTSAFGNAVGMHGHQNPPAPLGDRVYFHRSNAVICMGR
jgi:hypothetical protein